MPKELDRPRPDSSISDMLDSNLIEQATASEPSSTVPSDNPQTLDPEPLPEQQQQAVAAPIRTGEPADIQKMYRLTPTAYQALQQLRRAFSSQLGFDVAHSVVMRSVLYAVEKALPQIGRLSESRLQATAQPSTAIGNEHARDLLEEQLADIIAQGFRIDR